MRQSSLLVYGEAFQEETRALDIPDPGQHFYGAVGRKAGLESGADAYDSLKALFIVISYKKVER